MRTKVTIVVPVYGDWPSLKVCVESLKSHVDLSRHRVLFANDCGPEADDIERKLQETIAGMPNMEYVRNKKNLGFVKNCNNAVLTLDKTSNDILLLNSDTQVTTGFLEEMLSVLYAEEKIAAVSPRSNNATICTVPLPAMPQKGIDREKSYQLFLDHHRKFSKYHEVPTAHGFCILIRRNLIKQYGLFDTAFGRGYGEEVDFCQRLRAKGWKCALSNWAYVFHLEAKSFSMETKAVLLEANSKIIKERYPSYSQEVKNYVAEALRIENKIYGSSFRQKVKQSLKKLVSGS